MVLTNVIDKYSITMCYLSNNMRGDLAAIAAGYAEASAKRRAVTLLARPSVQKLIRDRQAELLFDLAPHVLSLFGDGA